jgi:aryl-alcohol dehydrogenase-like predicted oxidoreductase
MSPQIPTSVLGRTGLTITKLGYGAMELRDVPRGRPVTEEQAQTMLNAVLDSGITYIDTSNDYGRSEEFIGKYISGRRSEYYLATKCGCTPPPPQPVLEGRQPHVWTRENLFRGLNESLGRMKTDYVDVMQLHNPTVEESEAEDVVASLKEMQQQGKVRWIGVSTTLPHLPTYIEWGAFDVFQIPYSALERPHEVWISEAARAGIGTVIRGGVAKGEPGVSGIERPEPWEYFEKAKLDELRDEGESRTSFILRFTLAHPDMDTNIIGTLNPDHLKENVEATLRGPLSAEVYEEAKRRLADAGMAPAE